MQLLTTIFTGLVGLLIGAWINNVFTWKIKNKVEALDNTYKDALNLNTNFLAFIVDSNNHSNASGYVDSEEMARIKPKIDMYINNLYLYCFVIDGKKAGEFYSNVICPWGNFIVHTINGSNFASAADVETKFKKAHLKMLIERNTLPSELAVEYNKLFDIVQESILSRRTELTSFCHMLKECNPFKNMCTK